MPRWLATSVNIAMGSATAALMLMAVLGPGRPRPPALASQVGARAVDVTVVVTTARHATTSPGTRTTTSRATASSTTRETTTLPPRTAPRRVGPPPTRYSFYTVPSTTVATTTTTSTTIAPIGSHLPPAPSTLPLRTKAQNAHVSPIFPALSGAGFFVAFVIMATRFVLTRQGRRR